MPFEIKLFLVAAALACLFRLGFAIYSKLKKDIEAEDLQIAQCKASAKLSDENLHLQNDIRLLQAQLTNASQEIERLNSLLVQQKERLENTAQQLSAHQDTIAHSNNTLKKCNQLYQATLSDANALKAQIDFLRSELNKKDSALNDAHRKIAELCKEIEGLNDSIQQLKRESASVQQSLRDENDSPIQENKRSKKTISSLNSSLSKDDTIARLQYEIATLKRINGGLRTTLELNKQPSDIVIRYKPGVDPNIVRAKDERISLLEDECKQLEQKLNEVRAELSSANNSLNTAREELCAIHAQNHPAELRLNYMLKLLKPENKMLIRGLAFELQVGRWYENHGCFVFYSGIVLENDDHGIDLVIVPPDEDHALLIQCKNYSEKSVMQHKHVHSFLSATHFYTFHSALKVKPVLVHSPHAQFAEGVKDELSQMGIECFPMKFDSKYTEGIYDKLDQIRLEQHHLFFNRYGQDVFNACILHKMSELQNAHSIIP